MSKAVLISIRPKWCELIASRQKTVEVRKTKPKMETPFKCYIYCTKDSGNSGVSTHFYESDGGGFLSAGKTYAAFLAGTVIGEFICDKIYSGIICCKLNETDIVCPSIMSERVRKDACLSDVELHKYCDGKYAYGWHISDIVIYDKPKKLGEFRSWNTGVVFKDGYPMPKHEIKRPPQSWMYVEELT